MDAFAVAIGTSITLGRVNARQVFRLGFHFGLFQAMMPVLGYLAGLTFQDSIKAWDHWIAFGLLALIGGRAIKESLSPDEDESPGDPTKGMSLVTLSVATSIDALAVGMSFAMLGIDIVLPSIIIGLVAGAMTVTGMAIGSKLGSLFGRRMELAGGVVLLLIGLKILATHML